MWEKVEDRFSMSESQTALIFNLKFANINFPRVRKKSHMEKFEHFHFQMLLFQEFRCVTTLIPWLSFWRLPSLQMYVMSRALIEQIVTQSRRLVEWVFQSD